MEAVVNCYPNAAASTNTTIQVDSLGTYGMQKGYFDVKRYFLTKHLRISGRSLNTSKINWMQHYNLVISQCQDQRKPVT